MKGTYVDFRNEGEIFFEYWWWWTGTGSDFYGKLREVISSLPDKWMKQWKEFGYPQKVCAHSVADTIFVPLAFSNDMLELLEYIIVRKLCFIHALLSTVPTYSLYSLSNIM